MRQVLLFLIICTILLKKRYSSKRCTSRRIWDNPDLHVSNKIRSIKDISQYVQSLIYHQQNPISKFECTQTRLLVIDTINTKFEGIGTIMKKVIVGLAEAFHSNRTLVWGIELAYILDKTREEWDSVSNSRIRIGEGDSYLNCSTGNDGGPFDCFFQPMSLCSISDVSQKELLDLSINAFNTSSRIKLAEPYRTDISLYMPPKGLFGHINKIFNIEPVEEYLKIDLKAQLRRIWLVYIVSYIRK